MGMFNAPTPAETSKVEAHVDDGKLAITSLSELELVGRGSAIFETASQPRKGEILTNKWMEAKW